ncbi:MAG: GxxExxY protein [Pyrinomonadaceae bacterium]
MDTGLLHRELTDRIIGVFYDVYNELGFGFLESVYEDAMELALVDAGMTVVRQAPIPVWFRGRPLSTFEADLIVSDSIIIELKAASQLAEIHVAQLMHYLRATEIEVGLLMNFGPKPEFKRRVFENSRKRFAKPANSLIENLLT